MDFVSILRRWLQRLGTGAPPPAPAPPIALVPRPPLPRPTPGSIPPPPPRRIDPEETRWREVVGLLASGRAPEGHIVAGPLGLARLRLRSLPERLTVAGDLDLRQCERLRRIGSGLDVRGDLLIGGRVREKLQSDSYQGWAWREGGSPTRILARPSRDGQCPLIQLPEGLRVAGALRLRQCWAVDHWPKSWSVGGSIELEGCRALATLPEGLHVRGDLTLKGLPKLAALPRRLRVDGVLRLVGLPLTQLPDDLTLGGDLVLECLRLATLPEGLTVGGSLTIRRCPIVALPPGLRVGRDLTLARLADLADLPEDLAVPGSLTLDRCPRVRRIGAGLRVGSSLAVRRSPSFRDLPEGLHVPGALDLAGCTGVVALPRGLRVGTTPLESVFAPALNVADCSALQSLPDDIVVGGPIEVAGSGLSGLPEGLMTSARLLWRGVLIPPAAVFQPRSLTPDEILLQGNAELRRILCERYGLTALLEAAEAEVIDRDHDAGGERRLVAVQLRNRVNLPGQRLGRHSARYLHCRCPSTGRDFLLRVPPTAPTCRAAAAWLAGFDDPSRYRLVQET